MISMIVAIRI